jgi:hypothetical protein
LIKQHHLLVREKRRETHYICDLSRVVGKRWHGLVQLFEVIRTPHKLIKLYRSNLNSSQTPSTLSHGSSSPNFSGAIKFNSPHNW